jgi:hypothetical protein
MSTPYVGMVFLHKRVLDGNYQPARYTVTKIAQGVVYYKQGDERKAKQFCPIEDFSKYCLTAVEK